VARTKDGQLVVLHTRELTQLLKLAGGSASSAAAAHGAPPPQVGDFTWRQLQALRWPGGEGVETVEAVLHMVLPGTDHITLDVKTYGQVRPPAACLCLHT
jgi:glycerophosphoryl diester phosphodiesterase